MEPRSHRKSSVGYCLSNCKFNLNGLSTIPRLCFLNTYLYQSSYVTLVLVSGIFWTHLFRNSPMYTLRRNLACVVSKIFWNGLPQKDQTFNLLEVQTGRKPLNRILSGSWPLRVVGKSVAMRWWWFSNLRKDENLLYDSHTQILLI